MAPDDETRRSTQSREHGFEGRDLLVGRPEEAEGGPTARSTRAPPPVISPQPGAHDDAIGEILSTVQTIAARLNALQDTPGRENETTEALARETAALMPTTATRCAPIRCSSRRSAGCRRVAAISVPSRL